MVGIRTVHTLAIGMYALGNEAAVMMLISIGAQVEHLNVEIYSRSELIVWRQQGKGYDTGSAVMVLVSC